ncbi:RNA polymerase sigma-70 factor, ECF subfamily [Methylomagnum ishizawai]|uniref:RNA polymerase sigma-70 factor, ECF subfamily n=1 Tax=Methylomagnum ishizawai TaxID=1760988 RepID=A0A1Y6CU49_9GAMM|nr:sigma-70 family RNA polymerase sigma factor [Methylomagnum ishizawai]SMF94179.1 RNA polymerase sigma-70 factor, ECF subfamily [Methylomagnum ishizawai]
MPPPYVEAPAPHCDHTLTQELIHYFRSKLGCPEAAADLAQEAQLRLWQSARTQTIDNPRAYAFRVAANLVVDHLRRRRVQARVFDADADPEPSSGPEDWGAVPTPERTALDRERLEILSRAVNGLPPRCREVLVLRKFEGLDQAEIAARLGISRNMVEKHLRLALSRLQQSLDEA